MIKKNLIGLLIIMASGYIFLKVLSDKSHMDYGHHFNFENELGTNIDSLEISVGHLKTKIQVGSDSFRTLERNIEVPKEGYPHKVTIKVFANETTLILTADSFNCYNCDGYHEYLLKENGAEYHFFN